MRIVLLMGGLIIGSLLAFGQFGGNAVEVASQDPQQGVEILRDTRKDLPDYFGKKP